MREVDGGDVVTFSVGTGDVAVGGLSMFASAPAGSSRTTEELDPGLVTSRAITRTGAEALTMLGSGPPTAWPTVPVVSDGLSCGFA
jgi:hypothetical protein